MSSEGKWVTLVGAVQFEPEAKTIESSGTEVFEFQFREVGKQRRVKATVWPEILTAGNEEDVRALKAGDGVIVDGNLKVNESTNKDGDPVTYYNLSVGTLVILPQVDKVEREKASASSGGNSGGEDDVW